jgi:hypothetical protein
VGGVLDYMLSNRFSLGAEVVWNKWGLNSSSWFNETVIDISQSNLQASANVKYYLISAANTVYLKAGGGLYNQSYTITSEGFPVQDPDDNVITVTYDLDRSTSSGGLVLGAGALFSLSAKTKISLETNYHYVLDSSTIDDGGIGELIVLDGGNYYFTTESITRQTQYVSVLVRVLFALGGN